VGDDELMTIGRFAQLSGLSIGTLRHYDDVRLLPPPAPFRVAASAVIVGR